jgi:hypothetical protein
MLLALLFGKFCDRGKARNLTVELRLRDAAGSWRT